VRVTRGAGARQARRIGHAACLTRPCPCTCPGTCPASRRHLEQPTQAVDLLRHLREGTRRTLAVDRHQVPPRVVHRQQARCERQQRRHFRAHLVLAIGQLELIAQVVVEQYVVGLAFLRQLVEVDLAQALAPRRVEAAYTLSLFGESAS
jgi:hypothetical protein